MNNQPQHISSVLPDVVQMMMSKEFAHITNKDYKSISALIRADVEYREDTDVERQTLEGYVEYLSNGFDYFISYVVDVTFYYGNNYDAESGKTEHFVFDADYKVSACEATITDSKGLPVRNDFDLKNLNI